MAKTYLSTFRADVTPPVGHPLCGGWWVEPVAGVSEPLYALGIVLWSENKAPVVLCAVDWCEIGNSDYYLWCQHLAEAANTTPDRVSIHCVHQHNAPWLNGDAQKILDEEKVPWQMIDLKWANETLLKVSEALKDSLSHCQPVTHLVFGQAKVEMVASNRRILGPNGKVKAIRWTATKEPEVRAEPEGLIDPMLKTVSFWNGENKLAALHYYAVHPCSYYGDGIVTSDFVGLAREKRTQEEGVAHIYFTGCAGDITPGKYNDGSPENRPLLTERVYKAMIASEEQAQKIELSEFNWRVKEVMLPPREDWKEAELYEILTNTEIGLPQRARKALPLSYFRRSSKAIPISCLEFHEKVWILNLPGEAFIEYQLFAQQQRPDSFIAVASYSDCGPGYIPLARSFEEGGYEPTEAYASPNSETIVKQAIIELLRKQCQC